MQSESETPPPNEDPTPTRRSLLTKITTVGMAGGLAAGYGTFFAMAGRYLYPSESLKTARIFVTPVHRMKPGDALPFTTPTGQTVTITRRDDKGTADDFLALSSTCPHLGCRVHWEPHNNRFFCPCHNGVFDPTGKPTAGPPAEANQALPAFPLFVENGLLFIEVPTEQVG